MEWAAKMEWRMIGGGGVIGGFQSGILAEFGRGELTFVVSHPWPR